MFKSSIPSVIVFCICLCSSINSVAQDKYFYSDYFVSRVPEKTKNQRNFALADNHLQFVDYAEGKMILSGNIFGTTDTKVADAFILYARNEASEYRYEEAFAAISGEFTRYHNPQQPSSKVITRNKQMLYTQVWDDSGKELLTSGNGIYTCETDDKKAYMHTVFRDSLITSNYSVRTVQKDTIYGKFDEMAKPHEGLQAFTQELVRTVKYPTLARFVGKEGRAYISFIVDEQGKLTEFEPMSSEGFKFESGVISKLEKFPHWKPAMFNGRPVKSRFLLPIVYRLTPQRN